MLHAIGESSSENGHMVAFLQFQHGRGESDVGQGEQGKEESVHARIYRVVGRGVKDERPFLDEVCPGFGDDRLTKRGPGTYGFRTNE